MDSRCRSVQSLMVFDCDSTIITSRDRLNRTGGLRYHLRNAIRSIQTRILKRHLRAKGKEGSFRRHSSPEELYSMLRKCSTQYENGLSKCQSMCNLNTFSSVNELKSQLLSELSLLKCLIMEEEALLDKMDQLKNETSPKSSAFKKSQSSSFTKSQVFTFNDSDVGGYLNMTSRPLNMTSSAYMGKSVDALSITSTPPMRNNNEDKSSQILSYYYPTLPLHAPDCRLNYKKSTTRLDECAKCTCMLEETPPSQQKAAKRFTLRRKSGQKKRRPSTFYLSPLPQSQIDPKVIADIESFEMFAAQKLAVDYGNIERVI